MSPSHGYSLRSCGPSHGCSLCPIPQMLSVALCPIPRMLPAAPCPCPTDAPQCLSQGQPQCAMPDRGWQPTGTRQLPAQLPALTALGWLPGHGAHWQSGHGSGTLCGQESQYSEGQDSARIPQRGRASPQKVPAPPKTPKTTGLHPEHHPGSLTLAPTGVPRAPCLPRCSLAPLVEASGCWGHPREVRAPQPWCSPPRNRLPRTAEPAGGTSLAPGPSGRVCWRGPSTAGAAPAQLLLSVTLPVTVPLGSALPPAPRYGADPGVLGPQCAHVGGVDGEGGGHRAAGSLAGTAGGESHPRYMLSARSACGPRAWTCATSPPPERRAGTWR